MKQNFTADMLTPQQYKSMGIDIEAEMDAIQKAVRFFAYKRQIEVLHAYYTAEPTAYLQSQPEELANVVGHKPANRAKSPYPDELMMELELVDATINNAWEKIVKHTAHEKNDAQRYLDELKEGTDGGKAES